MGETKLVQAFQFLLTVRSAKLSALQLTLPLLFVIFVWILFAIRVEQCRSGFARVYFVHRLCLSATVVRWVLPVCGGVFAARTIFGFVARYALRDVEWRWFQGYIHYQNFWWQLSLRTCRSRCLICCKFTIYAHPYVISVFLRYAWSFWDCLLTSPQFLLILVILFSLLLYNLLSIRVKLT